MKIKVLITIIAGASLATLTNASAATSQGFGSIPGVSSGSNPYGGSGIPFNTSEYVQVTDLGQSADTLTFSLAATQYKSNPAPGNNNAGTYTVNTGLVGGRSTWNFDFYANSSMNQLGNYVFTLTATELAGGHTFSFNPAAILDNAGTAGTSFGNSESLDFSVFGLPLSYDANANDTYQFDLSVDSVTGAPIAHDDITVIAGTGAHLPDNGSTALLLGCAVAGLAFMSRRQLRFATVSK